MAKVFAGIDAGKEVHWLAVVDQSGETLLSRRVDNTEQDLTAAIAKWLL